MEQSKQGKERTTRYTGIGIALGASLGAIAGLLLGDLTYALGAAMGLALGLVVGMIADELGRVPRYTLTGLTLGLLVGGGAGLLLDLYVTEDAAFVITAIGLAIGLVSGTVIEVRRA